MAETSACRVTPRLEVWKSAAMACSSMRKPMELKKRSATTLTTPMEVWWAR